MFFFSSRRRHTRFDCDWSSDVCSSDLIAREGDDADRARALERVAQARGDIGNDGLGLGAVDAGLVEGAVELAPADPELRARIARGRGGEDLEAIVVVALVRERDQVLVLAAVVPGQAQLGDARADADVEQAR